MFVCRQAECQLALIIQPDHAFAPLAIRLAELAHRQAVQIFVRDKDHRPGRHGGKRIGKIRRIVLQAVGLLELINWRPAGIMEIMVMLYTIQSISQLILMKTNEPF